MRNKKDTSKPCPASLASLSSSVPTATGERSNCERESTIATGAVRDVFGSSGLQFLRQFLWKFPRHSQQLPWRENFLDATNSLRATNRQTLCSAGEGGFAASSSTGSSAPRAEFPHDRAGCPTLLLPQTIRLSETHASRLSKRHDSP